ncbi:hypothetical protein ABID22_000116 [Pontibacter aydingkolensis]|uniref:Uncharacterized protein n=1 Tax=Pontibacter aydingkolensis TaxID=1911536 RepID=A0ABS7CR75_9BACT|nr:hypothetical protein [Pontibacter aydingkolensis]MBW7466216.1 hypothetical protein [Pontibacter aydingkolensis]
MNTLLQTPNTIKPYTGRTIEVKVDLESEYYYSQCEYRPFDHTKYRKGLSVEVNGRTFASLKHLKDYSNYLLTNSNSGNWVGVRLNKIATNHFKGLFKLANVEVDSFKDLVLWKAEWPAMPRRIGSWSGVMFIRENLPDMQVFTVEGLITAISNILHPFAPSKIQGMIQHLKRWSNLPKEYTEEQILRVMKGEPEEVVFKGQEMYDWHGERVAKYYQENGYEAVYDGEFFMSMKKKSSDVDEPLPF